LSASAVWVELLNVSVGVKTSGLTARIASFTRSSVAEAADLIKRGGLIVYPTDTVYGLGADPKDEEAVKRLVKAKKRETKPIPVLCDSLTSALKLAWLNPKSVELARKYWPGALTIVAPLRVEIPFPLHQGTGTVGVRVPASKLCILLLRLCGGFLTGTSANVSGRPVCRTAQEAMRQLGTRVDIVLDGGRLEGMASTVVRVADEGIEVLREGPIGVNDEVVVR
jgi:L-threonylcarbamoyladenylate synthase